VIVIGIPLGANPGRTLYSACQALDPFASEAVRIAYGTSDWAPPALTCFPAGHVAVTYSELPPELEMKTFDWWTTSRPGSVFGPAGPAAPLAPVTPAGPVDPAGPSGPGAPVGPAAPIGPAVPA
jgi:hypothetical protein